jgi:hypothetical protein
MTRLRGGSRRLAGGIAFAALALVASCKRGDAPSEGTAARPAAPLLAPSAPPADHLAPGELIEGTQRAFGVLLPQVVRVRESFVDAVYASGPTTVAALVPYFRAHLRGGDLHVGELLATFDHVHAPPSSEAPSGADHGGRPAQDPGSRELRVRIATSPDGARVDIRDTTPPVIPAMPDDSARWKAAGLTPHGKVVDPTHLD